jgi:hexosaminidase
MKLLLFLFIVFTLNVFSKNPIIPLPSETIEKQGQFKLHPGLSIVIAQENDTLKKCAAFLNDFILESLNFSLPINKYASKNKAIYLQIISDSSIGKEGYLITIDDNVNISANHFQGLFYGIQSFRQILHAAPKKGSTAKINCCNVKDVPRFSYRGLLLDVSRHFVPKDKILLFLDNMAMHKLNTLHWHLTDDQGWRIEINAFPELTKIGAWREKTLISHFDNQPWLYDNTPYGGYYTQAEIKEIVAFAAERFITIIPEIDMPGHAQAAIASYPWLGCLDTVVKVRTEWGISPFIFNLKDTTFRFLEIVLDEVMSLFPSEYIHIGGDEVIIDQWKNSSEIQLKMQELGINSERNLQTWFMNRMND